MYDDFEWIILDDECSACGKIIGETEDYFTDRDTGDIYCVECWGNVLADEKKKE